MKTNFLLITIGISIITVSLLLSEPAFNGNSPGCGGGGCHSFQDGAVSVTVLDNLQVEVTVSGTSSRVGGELVDANGTVVDVIERTSTNPFILSAPFEGTYVVNAGYKSPSLRWDSTLVVLSGTVPDFLSVSTTNLTLGSGSGSNGQFAVSSNVSWSVSDDASWLNVSPTNGSDNGNVTVTATSSNPSTTNSRTATVTVAGGPTQETVNVTQDPSTPNFLTVSTTTLTIGSVSGSNGQFAINSNVSWSVSDDANWLTVSPTNGSNNGNVTVTATSSNPSTTNSRTATVTVAGGPTQETVTVAQNPITPSGFPVDLYATPETEKTVTISVSKSGNPPSTATYNITAFDPDHGGNDPPEGHAFVNGNGPIELFPGATQANGDQQTRDFSFSTPSSWWVDGSNELKFVRLLSTGYRIEAASVLFEVSDVNDNDNLPVGFTLEQNYPNPFNPSTTISYSISEAGSVTLLVYDMLGNEVAQLVNENKVAGKYNVSFDASNLSNGIYFYQLKSKNHVSIKKMVLLK